MKDIFNCFFFRVALVTEEDFKTYIIVLASKIFVASKFTISCVQNQLVNIAILHDIILHTNESRISRKLVQLVREFIILLQADKLGIVYQTLISIFLI